MPIVRKRSLLAAKIEATSGTAETLANADGAFNVFNVNMTPNITFTERQGNGSFSQLAAQPETYGATVTFSTEVYGNGLGTSPGWATTFLPACGWKATANTFAPVTDDAGTDVKTLTMGFFVDGLRMQMRGCAGSFKFVFEPGKLARIDWNFQGVWQAVADVAILTPTFPTNRPFRVANSVFTLGTYSPCFSSLEIDAGNEIFLRPCATNTDSSGLSGAIITSRKVNGTIDPESVLVATKNVYGNWLSGTEESFSFALSDATDKITIAMPKFQATNVQPTDRDGMLVDSISFQANRNAAAGNDELTIAFSAGP